MTQVGGQQGQVRFHVHPLAIPGDDPVHGHSVPQVMEARLPPIRYGPTNGGMVAETLKDFFKLLAGDSATAARRKKSGARSGRFRQGLSRLAVGRKHRAELRANGNDP